MGSSFKRPAARDEPDRPLRGAAGRRPEWDLKSKLLLPFSSQPAIRQVALRILSGAAIEPIVVPGHRAEAVEKAPA